MMTDLYTVSIAFRQPGTRLELQYLSLDSAEKTYAVLTAASVGERYDPIMVEDDYGAKASILREDMMFVLFAHANRAFDAQRAMTILQAHSQDKLRKEALADPLLRAALMAQANGGSPIIGAGRQ